MTDFQLRPSDEPQPKLLDCDPVTTDWPMPEPRKWEPRDESMYARAARMLDTTAQWWREWMK